MIRKVLILISLVALTACDVPTGAAPSAAKPDTRSEAELRAAADEIATRFVSVVETVRPVAERECRARTSSVNCNFIIVVDDRDGQPANAYQTLNDRNQPILAFTLRLIAEVKNADELAFIMGHEAAHHIEGHIARSRARAAEGATLLGGLAVLTGANAEGIQTAQRLGAAVGARRFSKEFELEADALGTVITQKAGFDPVLGSQYFNRIPDPGNRFLGTHPPNAARLDTVRRVARGG